MATKFTRVGTVEGDIWYATTASSTKSIQSLENNIDNAMYAFIGIDSTGGSTTSTSETQIGQVIVAANSVNTDLVILAGIRFSNLTATQSNTHTFNLYTGSNSNFASNTIRKTTVLQWNTTSSAGGPVAGAVMMARVTSAQETLSGTIYCQVTCTNASSNAASGICDWILVLGA